MNENTPTPVNLLLSRAELQLVLELLQASTIPGLEPTDPVLADISPDQQPVVRTLAERALRARELLHVQPEGELVIHRLLLSTVGTCAYPERALFVYRWPSGQDTPQRYFGQWRDQDIVAHTVPEAALHLFSLLPDREKLFEQALAAAGYAESGEATSLRLEVPAATFRQVRTLAAAGNTGQAVDLLAQHGGEAEAAQALAETLAAAPDVAIFQTLTPAGSSTDEVQRQDLTLLQSNRHSWLVYPAQDRAETLVIETASRASLLARLSAALQNGEES